MAVARWDLTWHRKAAWRRRLRRIDLAGLSLGVGAPCVMELRKVSDGTAVTPLLTLTAVVAGGDAVLTATREQIGALPGARYQHLLLAHDLVTDLPAALAWGWVSIQDRVGG